MWFVFIASIPIRRRPYVLLWTPSSFSSLGTTTTLEKDGVAGACFLRAMWRPRSYPPRMPRSIFLWCSPPSGWWYLLGFYLVTSSSLRMCSCVPLVLCKLTPSPLLDLSAENPHFDLQAPPALPPLDGLGLSVAIWLMSPSPSPSLVSLLLSWLCIFFILAVH
jgi:hypothetical protein